MHSNQLIEKLRNQLSNNETESVIKQLKVLFAHTPKLKKILQQEARHNRLIEQIMLGTISRDDENVEHNKIFLELFGLISKNTAEHEVLKEEVEQAITNINIENSKNVVVKSNIKAKTVNIGDNNIHYHYYGDKKVKRFLTLPPSKPRYFIGRDTEIVAIHKRLFEANDNILLLVNGEGGIGKTTLAAAYFHKYQDQYQHLAWVFVGTKIVDALLSLNISLKIEFPKKATAEERLDLLLLEMSNLNKPCLLIIDNANDIEDLEQYEQKLRQCPNFHLLLTSRINELEGIYFHKIKPLNDDDAKTLFKAHYPKLKAAELPILQQILEAIDNNTLVIELLGKSLYQKNRLKQNYTLTALLEDLQTKGLFQLKTDKKVKVDWNKKVNLVRASPEEVIAAMYDLEQLNEQEQLLLSNLSVLPAEYLPYDMLEPLLANIVALDETVKSLFEKGWLDLNESDDTLKIKVSPVTQAVCRQKNENLFENCQNLINKLVIKLKTEGGSGHLTNTSYKEANIYAQWSEYLLNKLNRVNHKFVILYERIGFFYKTIGNVEKALTFFEQGSILGKELSENYPENINFKTFLAISYQLLGITYSSLGNLKKALTFFEQYNFLNKFLSESYPKNISFKDGLATSYQYLGITHNSLGNLKKALTFFEQYNFLEKELSESYPKNVVFKNGLAISCQYLGIIHNSLGNLEKALTFFEQFNDLMESLCKNYPQNINSKNGLAVSYEKLGSVHSSLGNLKKALTFFEKFNNLMESLYESHTQNVSLKNLLAISYQFLGIIHNSLGNLEKALTFFEQFNDFMKSLYESYSQNVEFKNNLAISYEKLGEAYGSLGNLEKALGFFEHSNSLAKELYECYPKNAEFKKDFAILCERLGIFYRDKKKNTIKATIYFHQAYDLFKELVETSPDDAEIKDNFNKVKKVLAELEE